MRVLQLEAADAAAVAEGWGYYRAIEEPEISGSKWFSFGPNLIWWMNQNEETREGEVSLHLCIEPGHRRRVYGRKLLYAFEVVAELLGARAIVVWLTNDAVEAYVGRLGFIRKTDRDWNNARAWVMALDRGGEPHGWGKLETAAPEAGAGQGSG